MEKESGIRHGWGAEVDMWTEPWAVGKLVPCLAIASMKRPMLTFGVDREAQRLPGAFHTKLPTKLPTKLHRKVPTKVSLERGCNFPLSAIM